MAQRVTTLLICDLCERETEAIDTIVFGIGSDRFEIDACENHVNEIRGALARFAAAGRKATTSRSFTPPADRRPRQQPDVLAVADLTAEEREFARQQGWKGKRLNKEISDKIKANRA